MQQNFNSTTQEDDMIDPQENPATILNSESQNRVVNEDEETMDDEEDDTADKSLPGIADDQSIEENPLEQNDLLLPGDDDIEDVDDNSTDEELENEDDLNLDDDAEIMESDDESQNNS